MEISGSSIRHRTGVPKETNSSAKTLQQTQTEADITPAQQSGTSSKKLSLDRVFLII